jgi:hypothetical protein
MWAESYTVGPQLDSERDESHNVRSKDASNAELAGQLRVQPGRTCTTLCGFRSPGQSQPGSEKDEHKRSATLVHRYCCLSDIFSGLTRASRSRQRARKNGTSWSPVLTFARHFAARGHTLERVRELKSLRPAADAAAAPSARPAGGNQVGAEAISDDSDERAWAPRGSDGRGARATRLQRLRADAATAAGRARRRGRENGATGSSARNDGSRDASTMDAKSCQNGDEPSWCAKATLAEQRRAGPRAQRSMRSDVATRARAVCFSWCPLSWLWPRACSEPALTAATGSWTLGTRSPRSSSQRLGSHNSYAKSKKVSSKLARVAACW